MKASPSFPRAPFSTLGLLALGSIGAFLAGCSSVSVVTDYDRSANFGRYHTYAWAPEPPTALQPPPSVNAALHGAVDTALGTKGLQRSIKPDLIVSARVASRPAVDVRQRTEWIGYGGAVGYYDRRGRRGAYYPGPSLPYTFTEVTPYTEGRITLDLVDATSRRLLWRGEGRTFLDRPESDARRVAEAIERMLAQYPPGQPGAKKSR